MIRKRKKNGYIASRKLRRKTVNFDLNTTRRQHVKKFSKETQRSFLRDFWTVTPQLNCLY